MLTKLIVDLYGWIIEVSLWFILLISGVAGFQSAVPALKYAGLILEYETAWKILGAAFFSVVAFLVIAVLIGPFLVLLDIRKSVRALKATNRGGGSSGSQQVEYREPHL